MIDGNRDEGYELICDNCGEACEELFDDFHDAVHFKQDRDNGWKSVKDKNGDWQELCPSCGTREIVNEIKGLDGEGHRPIDYEKKKRNAEKLAGLALDEFEGF